MIAFTILIVIQLMDLVCHKSQIRVYSIQFKQMVKRDTDEMIRRGTNPVITTNPLVRWREEN